MSFSNRLKQYLEDHGISQAKAAKKCGIAQQSLNYILNNNLTSSKLAPKIAETLAINPDWLIYGHGKPEITFIQEIPIIHSPYMLKKFLSGNLPENTLEHTVSDTFLGNKAFAYLIESKKIILCYDNNQSTCSENYLTLSENEVNISSEKKEFSFPIFEWRERYEAF